MSSDNTNDYLFGDCRAAFDGGELLISNARIERRWRVDNGLLTPLSFCDRAAGREWLVAGDAPSPCPPGGVPDEERAVTFEASGGMHGPVGAPSLVATLTARGASATQRYRFQVYSGAAGVRMQVSVDRAATGERATDGGDAPGADDGEPTGIETAPATDPAAWMAADLLEDLTLALQHLRLVQVELVDQTDRRNELVFEREWLLHTAEAALSLSGNLFVVEDPLTGDGLIFLKEAPLPERRPVRSEHDLFVRCADRHVQFAGHGMAPEGGDGYRWATVAYQGGVAGRTAALQDYQRQVRVYDPARDGMFLSNTWGDRSRDGRINESFLTGEVEAAARLGVDVVQIDDGWQQGTTANSVQGGGVWEGFWGADSRFWEPHAERFPTGLEPLIARARERGMRFGLWFAPDSTDDFAHWESDADTILRLHRTHGVDYIKIDAVKLRTKTGEARLRRFYARVLEESAGRVVFDNDVTAEVRPGYFGSLETGPIFVENRYTDWHRYWPHQTLRVLWKLSRYVDPLRLRMEFLNHARNAERYAGDPLAPAAYRPDYLFATVMFSNPLGWFEVSNLPEGYFTEAAPLVAVWKAHREAIFRGHIHPVGDAPDGASWTGFVSAGEGGGGYVLLFRELTERARWAGELPLRANAGATVEILAGEGALAARGEGVFTAEIPRKQRFLLARVGA